MKRCPACRSQYSDDTLQYCLQDGTPLESVSGYPDEPLEEETVVSERRTHAVTTPDAETVVFEPRRRNSTGLIVFVSALGTMLLLAILGAGYWIASRGRQDTSRSTTNVNVAVVRTPDPTPSPTPTISPSPASNSANSNIANASPRPDAAEVGREITKAVAGWQQDTESLDIDNLAGRYADTVDYYRNAGASRDFVIRDKERAFSMYDSIRFEISNMQISAGKSPDTATAEFDKAWVFEGENHSEGKVRTRLNLRKTGGRWLIDGERDIKVY